MATLRRPKVLLITWIDSFGDSGWQQQGVVTAKALLCETIGFFVDESADAIAVALNRATDDRATEFGEVIHIPKVAIKSKRVIKF